MIAELHLTQHKRFVPYGDHPNPSLTLKTSFMMRQLGETVGLKNSWGTGAVK